jgi:triacylglycerol lipase
LTLKRQLLNITNYFIALMLIFISAKLTADELDSVNFAVLHQHAIFARAVYQSEDNVRVLIESSNYSLTLYHTIPGTQISFLLATNKLTRTQIIAVRGTTNIENAMIDISLKLVLDQKTGIRLHDGFSFAAKQVYAELKPMLKADYKINLTGHSLGGAVALILAIYLDADQFNVEQVTTFGQPKVTNIAGANKIQHINVIRVVTPLDLVPLVPLFDPLDLSNVDVYWHAGQEVILLANSQYAVLQGTESMLRASGFTQRLLSEENLQHHQMTLYQNMVRARIKSSELVPYQNNYNLFNLFGSE